MNKVASQMVQRNDVGSVYGGVQVDGNKGLMETLDLADLNWEVDTREISMSDRNHTKIPGYFATYRKDNNTPLGVVKSRYCPVQNRDAFKWIEDVIGSDQACISSAGALYEGRRTWVCVDLGGFEVVPDDEVRKHMLVMNSHDGSSNVLVQLLPNRIACQNILNFSLGARGNNSSSPFKIKHTDTAMMRLSEVKEVLAIANRGFDEVHSAFDMFKDTPITFEQGKDVIHRSLGVTKDDFEEYNSGKSDRLPQWVNQSKSIIEVIEKGPGSDIPGVRDSLWGTFNGINGYFDNVRTIRGSEKNPDTAIESKLMGNAAKMKTKAFEVCLEVANELRN